MNKGFINTILVILFVFIFLFASNPNDTDYKLFLKNEIQLAAKENMEDDFLGKLAGLFSGAVAEMAGFATEKKDLFIFSLYTTQIDDNNKVKYLGILNHFFLLESEGDLFSKK
jgi:hypothetical protein